MSKYILKPLILIQLCLLISSAYAIGGGLGVVSVNGYYRQNGTYVTPYMRSAPDGNFGNNWSTKGNINPYTGKEGRLENPSTSNYGYNYNSNNTNKNNYKVIFSTNTGTNLYINSTEFIRMLMKDKRSFIGSNIKIVTINNQTMEYKSFIDFTDCHDGSGKIYTYYLNDTLAFTDDFTLDVTPNLNYSEKASNVLGKYLCGAVNNNQ